MRSVPDQKITLENRTVVITAIVSRSCYDIKLSSKEMKNRGVRSCPSPLVVESTNVRSVDLYKFY